MDFIGYNLELAHDSNINISSAPLVILLIVLVVLMIFYVILIMMTVLYELFEDLVISVTQILFRKSKKSTNPDCNYEKHIRTVSNDIEMYSNSISINLNVKDEDEVELNENVDTNFNKLNEVNNEELSNTVTKTDSLIQNGETINVQIHFDANPKYVKCKMDIILEKFNHILNGISKHKNETQFRNQPVFVI
jgi:hypothetical protein